MNDDAPSILEVGRIGRPHGLRGELVVKLTTNRLERVAPGAVLHADDRRVVVRSSRPHKGNHIVVFDGVTSREHAQALVGVALKAAPLDDEAALWVHDLIGCHVVETDGTDRGLVESVEANPASDLLVLDSGALVPLRFVVDGPSDGRVVIDPPAGLFDL